MGKMIRIVTSNGCQLNSMESWHRKIENYLQSNKSTFSSKTITSLINNKANKINSEYYYLFYSYYITNKNNISNTSSKN
jgi:hypothetical protein